MHTVLQGGIFLTQTMQWQVNETFTFPNDFGCVKDVKLINVQPNWECEQLSEELLIQGIYHIMARVEFDHKKHAHSEMGTLIEHVDLLDNEGYFEYALPFRMELPKMEVKNLRVKDIQTTCGDAFDIAWQVMCVYDEITTTNITDHEKIFIEKAAESSEKSIQVIHNEKVLEDVMESSVKEIIEVSAEKIVEKVADAVVEEAAKETIQEIAEEIAIEITEEIADKIAVNMVDEVEELIEERVEEYIDESRPESTEFLFHLEDGYRKETFALNKVRNQ